MPTRLALALTLLAGPAVAADVEADTYLVGVAEIDATPAHPIRLNGFGGRRAESEGAYHPIFVRAISIRHRDSPDPVVLLTADVFGIPAHVRAELVKRLAGVVKPERLAATATHTHGGPMLAGANPTLFGVPIPVAHQANIDRYSAVFLDKLEAVARAALKDPTPAKLYWGVGSVGFARNRRAAGGPTDHELPVLVVRDAATNAVRAVYTSYACHCVTLSHNLLGGDWAGFAAEAIRAKFPGAVCLVSVGCGADQNPDSGVTGANVEAARVQGRQIADEIARVAAGFMAPVRGMPNAKMTTHTLPLADLPDRKGWETRAARQDAIGHHARVQLAKLDRGEKLPNTVEYPVQTWAFGESLALVHLPGEVVVDYALRLKDELDRGRVWVTAYANGNPCYIPSERILKEGGYEGGGAMVYYDLPASFRPGLEAVIVGEVKSQLGATFAATFSPTKTGGGRPMSPQQSQKVLRAAGSFAVDLVAAEPLVADPVAIAFGADGKLWVAEMLDYPSGATGQFEPGGRIRVLDDADGDGTFDRATTFLDKLPFPTGVLPWRNGVFVCAAPDILYAEDTNGDGRADVVTKLFSGFGTSNYQARVNGLTPGLDGWIYGSCGLFGGAIRSHKTGKTLALGDRDFRIRPETGDIEPATGRTQQGRGRNDWGDWFGCDNSTLGWHYALADDALRRNPVAAPPNPAVPVAGADAARLVPGRGVQLFALSGPAGRATAACGLGIYRDDRLGRDFAGNLFTCEPVNLVVARRSLTPNGSTFRAERPSGESDREFLASADPWFRPVQAVTGPDGGLWVADMYRFVIEHPRWIPPAELAKLDIRAGAGLGRIYRVRPAGDAPRAWPRLDKLDAAGLVAALDSPNGWQRDAATELLVWKADAAAVPLLEELTTAARPEARLHALVALHRLGGLTAAHAKVALADAHPGVRRHAVRLAERFLSNRADLAASVAALAGDPDAQVRLQVAYSLGAWADAKAGESLAALAKSHAADPFLTAAVVSSLTRHNFRAFVDRFAAADLAGSPLLPALIATAVGTGDAAAMAPLLDRVTAPIAGKYAAWQFAAFGTVLDALDRGKAARPAGVATAVIAARAVARDGSADVPLRAAAVALVGRGGDAEEAVAALAPLLVPQSPIPIQTAAVAALGRIADARAADALLAGWPGYSPAIQARAMSALLAREAWVPRVLAALAAKKLPNAAVPAGSRQGLLTHPDAAIRKQAEAAFAGAADANRARVVAAYTSTLPKAGDATRGRAVFGKSCAACHRLDGTGHAVGPDLAALANKSPEYLLAEILDPSRNLDNRYLEYAAHAADGRVVTGLLAAETSAAVTLKQADGKETTLLRADLDSLKSAGRSLMPDGLEKDIPPAAMADLVAYLGTASAPAKTLLGNAPAVVRTVGGKLTLPAAAAEIRGGAITFETDFGNVGYWHSSKDHVAWRVEIDRGGAYDVYLDYACAPDSAGNAIALDGGDPTLRGTVASTGAWSAYRWMKLGTLKLPAGPSRLTLRSDAAVVTGALIDLRTILLLPAGSPPPNAAPQSSLDPAALAKALLDDATPTAAREALLARHTSRAGPVVRAMTVDLQPGKEEYRRIPWIWRASVAAGKRNDAAELRALLDASLPALDAPLRDWQAVVLGGGVINGLTQAGAWPGPRVMEVLGTDKPLAARWTAVLAASAAMADDDKVPHGTRYDALRMVALRGWKEAGPPLTKYLAKGSHAELQMGAVSGLADIDAPEATAALVAALGHLAGTNRTLALQGLVRTDARAGALLDAVEAGAVKVDALGAATAKALTESKNAEVRARAARVLGK